MKTIDRVKKRLGGRRNRNRLIDNEIQIANDPRTGEITNWQVPPEQPPNLLNRTAQTLRNTAQNISDRVNNIRQQITGRITNTGRGRYSRLARNEAELEPMEQSVQRQTNEPPIQDITQEIMNPLHESARGSRPRSRKR